VNEYNNNYLVWAVLLGLLAGAGFSMGIVDLYNKGKAIEAGVGQYNSKTAKFEYIRPRVEIETYNNCPDCGERIKE